jgi:cell surface protein SprA
LAISKILLPNRITYDGLARIRANSTVIETATLSHAYRSIYAISQYQSNLYYSETDGTASGLYNQANSFYPEYDLAQVTIQEQFAPLIGLDLGWRNSLLTRGIPQIAQLTSMATKQLTDLVTEEIIGLGYRVKMFHSP